MSERLISQLQSFLDRLKNDTRSALMFEGDADTLREAMARIKADGLRVDYMLDKADKDVIRIAALERDLAAAQSEVASEKIKRECAERRLAAAQAVLPCGHHNSLMLKSAETGEPLYCELCDCISRRNDFETDLNETKAFVAALQGLHAGDVETLKAEQDALREKANALLHQIDIGDYVDSEGHVLKNNIAVLILMKALTNA